MGSVSTTAPETDLTLIMDGGENFLKRMAALQSEKKALQEARDNLHLAIDLKRGSEEVATARADVARETVTAKQDAAALRKQAEEDAANIVLEAHHVRDAADSYAKQKRDEADAYDAKVRSEASTNERVAHEAAAAASASLEAAQARHKDLDVRNAKLEETAAQLRSAEAAHKERVAMLGDVLSKLA